MDIIDLPNPDCFSCYGTDKPVKRLYWFYHIEKSAMTGEFCPKCYERCKNDDFTYTKKEDLICAMTTHRMSGL